ncbi:MAG: hypothetical protein FJ213_05665 [Ignavibacteria bacterium]|nr:hypothetical protein [Ignavibacteria bacterium]
MNLVSIRRLIFFICSSIIIGLLVAWGVEGFHLLTETKTAVQIEDRITGMVYTQSENKFSMGLDLVALISLVVVGVGLVAVNLVKIFYPKKS